MKNLIYILKKYKKKDIVLYILFFFFMIYKYECKKHE